MHYRSQLLVLEIIHCFSTCRSQKHNCTVHTVLWAHLRVFLYFQHQDILYQSVPLCSVLLCDNLQSVCVLFLLFPRCKGEVGQEILCGRRFQLHLFAAQPGGRHAVCRSQGGTVCPQPLGHQQDQAAEEREYDQMDHWRQNCNKGLLIDMQVGWL